jgi:hypothetical protein
MNINKNTHKFMLISYVVPAATVVVTAIERLIP